jgi:hypothetical protein
MKKAVTAIAVVSLLAAASAAVAQPWPPNGPPPQGPGYGPPPEPGYGIPPGPDYGPPHPPGYRGPGYWWNGRYLQYRGQHCWRQWGRRHCDYRYW